MLQVEDSSYFRDVDAISDSVILPDLFPLTCAHASHYKWSDRIPK